MTASAVPICRIYATRQMLFRMVVDGADLLLSGAERRFLFPYLLHQGHPVPHELAYLLMDGPPNESNPARQCNLLAKYKANINSRPAVPEWLKVQRWEGGPGAYILKPAAEVVIWGFQIPDYDPIALGHNVTIEP